MNTKDLENALQQIADGWDDLGCGDSGCELRKTRGGQHTNGGCRCGKEARPSSEVRVLRTFIARARHTARKALGK